MVLADHSRVAGGPANEPFRSMEVTTMRSIHWTHLGLLAFLLVACGEATSVQHGNWEWEDSGMLLYLSEPLLEELAENQVNVVTPLGTFLPRSNNVWDRVAHNIPLVEADRTWVRHIISSTPFTEAMNERGYYRVDELTVEAGTWRDTQLEGTPSSWIYPFKQSGDRERGYWISPQKLADIDWSEL